MLQPYASNLPLSLVLFTFTRTTILSCMIVVCRPPEQGISLWGWHDLPPEHLGPCLGFESNFRKAN